LIEVFKPKKLKSVNVKKQYQVESRDRFAALENLDCNMDISRTWESVGDSNSI
jgi:hypothetical protein